MHLNDFVSRELIEKYKHLVLKWNKKINLISPKSVNDIEIRHFLDSAQLLKLIKKDDTVIDFGSGGGFPGLVLSFGGVEEVTMVESDERKCAFLEIASKLTKNNVTIINSRIEKIDKKEYNILTCRAFAEISKVFEYSLNVIIKKKILLHKGKLHEKEIEAASRDWLFDYKIHDSITSEEGKIIEISNLMRR